MLIIKKIELNNFGLYRHVSLDTHFPGGRLIFVRGRNRDSGSSLSNGSGKSTLISDALCWVFFGKMAKGIDGLVRADDVVNRVAKKDCWVSIHCSLKEKNLIIRRFRKGPDGKSGLVIIDEDGGERIELPYQEGTQEVVENLLGMDWTVFVNTQIFAQSVSSRFPIIGDTDKKRILESICGFEFWESAMNHSSRYLDAISEKQNLISAKQNRLQGQLQTLDPGKDYSEELKRLRVKIKDTEAEIKKVKIDESKEEKIRNLIARCEEIIYDIETKEEELRSLKNRLDEKCNDIRADIKFLERQMSSEEGQILSLEEQSGGTCPSCGQTIGEGHVRSCVGDIRKSIATKKGEHSALIAKIDPFLKKHREMEVALQRLGEREAKAREKQNEFHDDLVKATRSNEKLYSLNEISENLKRQIYVIESHEEKRKEVMGVIERTQKELDSLNEQDSNYEDMKGHYQFWKEAFGPRGIRSLLLDEVVGLMNGLSNEYSASIVGNEIVVSFSTLSELGSGKIKDRLSIKITNRGEEYDYILNGGGDQRIADLLSHLCLSRISTMNGHGTNIKVFDEPEGHLDSTRRVSFVKMLDDEAKKNNATIFVISHDQEMEDYFDYFLEIERVGHESHIVSG